MEAMLKVAALLPWTEWAAALWFFAAWTGYARFAHRRAETQPSLLAASNRIRREWMLQTTSRDVRVVDGVVVQNLTASSSFFASTTIIIIGGLLAVLGTSERATALVQELPFAVRTSALVFDLKLLVLTSVFVFAFFRFTWSLRQYSFGALLIASAVPPEVFAAQGEAAQRAFADRAGVVMGLAAESFNDGLRAYYMAFATLGWFVSPLAFVFTTAGVLWVLYQREFRSDVLAALRA